MDRIAKWMTSVAVVCMLAAIASLLSAKKSEGLVATAVQVVNTPLSVNTESPVKVPFATTLYPGGTFAVPAGQRLVIEFVSGGCVLTTPGTTSAALSHLTLQLATTSTGEPTLTTLAPQYQGLQPSFTDNPPFGLQPITAYYFVYNHPVKIYADPSSTLTYNLNAPASIDSCPVTLSGYLINP